MSVRQCSSAHCSAVDAEINQICKDLGWPVNHPVLTRDSQGPCTCSCSCLAFGTLVQDSESQFKAIETFKVGDAVRAAGKDLVWDQKEVKFSQGTTGASRQKYAVVVQYLDREIVVTSDHLFLMQDKTLRAADRLAPGDMLTSPEGDPVEIKSVYVGDYLAGFHHIATSKSEPGPDLAGHLLNTNGVVSADYMVQIFYKSNDPMMNELMPKHDELPIVGSPEYLDLHGDSCYYEPTPPMIKAVNAAPFNVTDITAENFVPTIMTKLKIPDDACGFISKKDAIAKMKEPKRAWNDPMAREWTEYLIQQHKYFYPNIHFEFDWANDEVNAYAWVQNGVRYVAILGGLVRNMSIKLEGIALVLSHELAHHYGGPPTFPSGLSCEGQADYYGVAVIMRNVWFGMQYIEMADPAISQMADFFGVPDDAAKSSGNAGCSHPPGACRIKTYHAAVELAGKPGCAS